MATAEDRQATSLAAIAFYMKQLVPIFETINSNLAELGKLIKKNEEFAAKELNEKLAPEGYEFVKETPCKGCGLLYCEIPGCGSPEVDKKEGE